jgi:hypothetical protein
MSVIIFYIKKKIYDKKKIFWYKMILIVDLSF